MSDKSKNHPVTITLHPVEGLQLNPKVLGGNLDKVKVGDTITWMNATQTNVRLYDFAPPGWVDTAAIPDPIPPQGNSGPIIIEKGIIILPPPLNIDVGYRCSTVGSQVSATAPDDTTSGTIIIVDPPGQDDDHDDKHEKRGHEVMAG